MDDIVEKLRDYGFTLEESMIICDRSAVEEAAGVIENQRRDLAEQKLAHGDCIKRNIALAADNARLAKELEEARKAAFEEAAQIALAIIPAGGARIIDQRRDHAHSIAAAIRQKSDVPTDDQEGEKP